MFPRVPVREVGASGYVAGVTEEDAVEEGEFPKLFVAITTNVYGVPFVRPVTMALVVFPSGVVAVNPPGVDVTVYDIIERPPFDAEAVHDTVTCVFPTVPLTFVGADGTTPGIMISEGKEAIEFPKKVVAITVNV